MSCARSPWPKPRPPPTCRKAVYRARGAARLTALGVRPEGRGEQCRDTQGDEPTGEGEEDEVGVVAGLWHLVLALRREYGRPWPRSDDTGFPRGLHGPRLAEARRCPAPVRPARMAFRSPLPRGAVVAQQTLDLLTLVRIQAGQPTWTAFPLAETNMERRRLARAVVFPLGRWGPRTSGRGCPLSRVVEVGFGDEVMQLVALVERLAQQGFAVSLVGPIVLKGG